MLLFLLLLMFLIHLLVCVLVLVVGVGVGVCTLNNGCELLLMCCRETLEPLMHWLEQVL